MVLVNVVVIEDRVCEGKGKRSEVQMNAIGSRHDAVLEAVR